MKHKKAIIIIPVLIIIVILIILSIPFSIRYLYRKHANDSKVDSSTIHHTPQQKRILSKEIDPFPPATQLSIQPISTTGSTKTTSEQEPTLVMMPLSTKKPPEPGCIYLGAKEAEWHCYRRKRRLILFHDWQCSNKKITRVEIIRETNRRCFDDSGADSFELINNE